MNTGMVRNVTNQADLDLALSTPGVKLVYLDASGQHLTAETSPSQTVYVEGSTTLSAHGEGFVLALNTSTVYAYGSVKVLASDHSHVRAYNDAQVTTKDAATWVSAGDVSE